jgi:hypothetical protein
MCNVFNSLTPAVTIRTDALIVNNSVFCTPSVFICFDWFSEQTAIISLNRIHKLIFVMVKCSVFFAVQTECLSIIETSFGFKRDNSIKTKFMLLWILIFLCLIFYFIRKTAVRSITKNKRFKT